MLLLTLWRTVSLKENSGDNLLWLMKVYTHSWVILHNQHWLTVLLYVGNVVQEWIHVRRLLRDFENFLRKQGKSLVNSLHSKPRFDFGMCFSHTPMFSKWEWVYFSLPIIFLLSFKNFSKHSLSLSLKDTV